MTVITRRVLFFLFFLSGFCSLVYQVVWTRMAFASFGIITPVLSVVISVFMLGLSIGAWAGGRWVAPLTRKTGLSAVLFYALTEFMIGVGAFVVPKLFAVGEHMLLSTEGMDSFHYLLVSAFVLGLSILPWCILMGATFPLMMAFVRERDERNTESFSYLYLANVLGAMSGTLLAAVVLIEIFGFKGTLSAAATSNFAIAAISGYLAWKCGSSPARVSPELKGSIRFEVKSGRVRSGWLLKWVLFCTGFSAMAMEVVWVRAFTPVLKTQVYSFAMIVFAYLGATFFGSALYRRALRRNRVRSLAVLVSLLSIATFFPIILNDVRFLHSNQFLVSYGTSSLILLLSICPLCTLLGYLTPSLIDEDALGDPAAAGKVYALNVLGCILGPLFASYFLLPSVGERYALVFLGLPFLLFFLLTCRSLPSVQRIATVVGVSALLLWSLFGSIDFVESFSKEADKPEVRRDYAASVISIGQDRHKRLLVNGIGMTALIPDTKFMIHLPLLLHTGRAESALIICFGMGTTFRSALSWNIETTAVELVPSVKDAFGFYHSDARRVLNNPNAHIVVDDGRRYLERTRQKFDVIVIDPPPPVEAAGSSLLYSEEFYELAKQHLKAHGIVQAWFPRADRLAGQAVFRSVQNSFPYVECFGSIGQIGTHILASMEPIAISGPDQLVANMPASVAQDLMEWNSSGDLRAYLNEVLSRKISIQSLLNPDPQVRIVDDRPFNEYFLLRKFQLLKRGVP